LHSKESKAHKTIELSPIAEEKNKDVETIDKTEPLRKEITDLLQTILEKPIGDNDKTYETGSSQGNVSEEPSGKEIYKVGMFCRGVYQEDGIEYEGIVKSIASSDGGDYAVVQFIGYGNEEPFWFQDLLESKGEEAREKQRKEALGEENVPVDNLIDIEEETPKEGWFCRGVYTEDGLEYEGVVKSIASTNVGSYAVVQFLGYGNEQPIWFKDILKSHGEEARKKQMMEAGVVDVDETMVQTANKEPMTTEKPNDVGSKQKVDETNSNQGEKKTIKSVIKNLEKKLNEQKVEITQMKRNHPEINCKKT